MSALADLARTGWRLTSEYDPAKKLFIVRLRVRTMLASATGMTYPAAVKAGYEALGYTPAGEHADPESAAKIALAEYEKLRSGPLGRFIGSSGQGETAPRTRTRSAPAPAPRTRERTRA